MKGHPQGFNKMRLRGRGVFKICLWGVKKCVQFGLGLSGEGWYKVDMVQNLFSIARVNLYAMDSFL